MAPLVHALASDPDIEAKVCVTAQHREMLDQVLTLFSIVPDYDLNIMKPGQGLTEITCRILQELKPILESFKPDVVLVHGDTTTTVATSLAAFYQRIPVGHVEAGLRTGNLYSPWPEEANRTLTGHLAMYHFAPTENSRQNLLRENIADNKIFVTGNTVIDALIWVRDRVLANSELQKELAARYPFLHNGKKTILVTGHRRESFGRGFEQICHALAEIAAQNDDVQIVYPVYLNPNVSEPVNRILGHVENVLLIEPQDYMPFVWLMNHAWLILTDSGGIQEEGRVGRVGGRCCLPGGAAAQQVHLAVKAGDAAQAGLTRRGGVDVAAGGALHVGAAPLGAQVAVESIHAGLPPACAQVQHGRPVAAGAAGKALRFPQPQIDHVQPGQRTAELGPPGGVDAIVDPVAVERGAFGQGHLSVAVQVPGVAQHGADGHAVASGPQAQG